MFGHDGIPLDLTIDNVYRCYHKLHLLSISQIHLSCVEDYDYNLETSQWVPPGVIQGINTPISLIYIELSTACPQVIYKAASVSRGTIPASGKFRGMSVGLWI